jgi:DNA-binding XRE family transcriptional regulator
MTVDLKLDLGTKIRAAREVKRLSQEQLAEMIDRTPESISNIERGRTLPSLDTAQALCLHLGLKLGDLFTDDDERSPERVARETAALQRLRDLALPELEVAEATIAALHRLARK